MQKNLTTITAHSYKLCGWHTVSDMPLSNAPIAPRGDNADVSIEVAAGPPPAVEKTFGREVLEHSGEGWLIKIPDVADFEVIEGRRIRVWPAPYAAQTDIEIFIFGLVWATLCHQRGLLPLHASAIRTAGGIAAFAGPSGAGKSTTAALMGLLGHELVTDDMLPITLNKGTAPGAWPYLRRLKLRPDPIMQLSLTPTELVSKTIDSKKYFVRPSVVAADKWNRLDRIYLLESDTSDTTESFGSIQQITGADAVRALIDQTYYLDFVLDSGRFREHLALCTQLSTKIPIYRLRFSRSPRIETTLTSHICAHLQKASG